MPVDFLRIDTEIQRMTEAPNNAAKGRHAVQAYSEIRLIKDDPDLTPEDKKGLSDRLRTILIDGFAIDPDAPPPRTEAEYFEDSISRAVKVARKNGLSDEQMKAIVEGVLNGSTEG